MRQIEYARDAAVEYAREWFDGRNPRFYDFANLGGDCTNFVSQCVYAGNMPFNFTKDTGWYYININSRAAAWSGVEFFYKFLTRQAQTPGPIGEPCERADVQRGDIVQFSWDGITFDHTSLVVNTTSVGDTSNIYVSAHDNDVYNKNIENYPYVTARFIHISGGYAW